MITLTPMLVQYLTGLCCLRTTPEAVDIILGDMVLDPAAEKKRDVDITVTIAGSEGLTHAFKAYEVKRERTPLDVSTVEKLCIKLADMPSVTHRAIVSISGFSEGAKKKAAHHGVELYEFKPWTRPLQEQFPELTMQESIEEHFQFKKALLCWIEPSYALVSHSAKNGFLVQSSDRLFDSEGKQHGKFQTFGEYQHELLLRSTEILFPLEPAATVLKTFPIPFSVAEGARSMSPAWPHTHTFDVAGDAVYIDAGGDICRLDIVTINGHLQWQRSNDKPLYYILENVKNGEAFAGAIISEEIRDGHMTALVFSPHTREIGVHFVRLAEKHLNCIRNLKLKLPEEPSEREA
ncbi:hypothetical protein [Glaciimonas soli]|uniref:Restriction endonuclease n=1 Tax=Glaciimonas soli TaxID=2590999 RepID=A0A843YS23_9BURK|nr:hypothetical protein [Glaciimonas soli]MQR02365.1 hypothetical protein [Glaciimonas soli]